MKYLSKYSNGKTVSAAQYITEIICEHLATKDKKDLHYRFWLSKEWAQFYKSQIFTAHKLLVKYPEKAIIKALCSPETKKIFSLRAPHLGAIIEKHAKLLAAEQLEKPDQPKVITRNINQKAPNTLRKKTTLDKLKDIDNEH
jgi:hypothetical protein